MESLKKNLIVDADAHVVECARTWDFMDKSEQQYRPLPLEAREEAGVRQQFWLIDGKVRGFRFAAFSDEELAKRQQQVGRKFADQQESRELGNVDLRLQHMDDTDVDVQVLHNTMFIESCTNRPAVDVALCKSWNRWLADIWKQSEGRLRWSCMPPLLSMTDVLDQIRWSKENGAVAVCLRPRDEASSGKVRSSTSISARNRCSVASAPAFAKWRSCSRLSFRVFLGIDFTPSVDWLFRYEFVR